jgi:hypothetical protein
MQEAPIIESLKQQIKNEEIILNKEKFIYFFIFNFIFLYFEEMKF